MAQNEYAQGVRVNLAVPSGVKSGDPVLIGTTLVGVADSDRDASGKATVVVGSREWLLPVKGVDQNGNSAVAVGDYLYIVMADTPHVSKKNTGYLFGKALGTVTSGGTTTILVLLIQV